MLRLLLITLVLAPGCSCGSHGSDPDAAAPADVVVVADDALFVRDARPRDATLPCEGTVALLPVDTSVVPDANQRVQVRATREGDGMVVGWFNQSEAGMGGAWMAGRVGDADAPVVTLVDPLPLPGLVGLYTTDGGAVRFLITEASDPRNGVSGGGWADLAPDGSFGALHGFEVPLDGLRFVGAGLPCAGGDSAALYVCSTEDAFGATVVEITDTGATVFTSAFGRVLGSCGRGDRVSYGIAGCVAHAGVTSVLMIGRDSTQPPAVVEWRPGGSLLRAEPVPLGTESGEVNGIAALDAVGPVYFVLAGSPAPRIAAYRVSSGAASLVGEHALDAFPDAVAKPLGVAVLSDTRLMVVYTQSGVLSVIAFDEATGFGGPVIVSNGAYSGPQGIGVALPSGVYLPLGGADLFLLRLCGG